MREDSRAPKFTSKTVVEKIKEDMEGGTEAFPDLGRHCQRQDCHQLDFLPFKCDGCQKVFCLEHRSFKSHDCPKQDHKSRIVIVCELCAVSIETTGDCGEEEQIIMLEKHKKSGECDPKKKEKPTCPIRRCKERLTFSNSTTCKHCNLKLCLRHRFPADHSCKKDSSVGKNDVVVGKGRWNDKFLVALASRNGKECGKKDRISASTSSAAAAPSVKAC